MGRRYAPQDQLNAAELFVVHGLTLAETAAELDLPLTTVRSWSRRFGWGKRRGQYQEAMAGIREDTARLRKRLVAKALETLDHRDINAAVRLQQVFSAEREAPRGGAAAEEKNPASPAQGVQAAVSARLARMASQPGQARLGELKDLKKVLEMAQELEAGDKTSPGGQMGREAVEFIEQELFGLGAQEDG